jgi:signal transduction histidine kinase
LKRNSARRIIYTRTSLAFFAIYFVLIIGFTIFLISKEKKDAGKELWTYAASVNNRVGEILKDNIDSNNQVTDITKIKKYFVEETSLFTYSGTEMAVFTGDYNLLLNTKDYWLCSYTEYTEGNRHYTGYGYLNPKEWFTEKEIAELENYLYANPKAKKAGDLSGYVVNLDGFWVDNEMIIPDKITIVAMYAKTFDENGNVSASSGKHIDDIVYTSGYENTRDLQYFQNGFIQPKIIINHNSEKQNELRQMVTDEKKLKESIISLIPRMPLNYSVKRIGLLTYRYYLPMPYQNSIRGMGGQNYYSDFWTVIGRDINIWVRCSTTLIFVWVSCFIIFAVAALILSKQTYKIYKEREELEKQRQEMTNALAHDLKTPLSIISGYAQNLQENIHTDKREYYASHILANVNRMTGIIRDMLEMSRLETEPFQIKFEDISLAEACNKIINRYKHISDEKAIKVCLEGDAVVKADSSLMMRVIDNFFINALDNTPKGGSICIRIFDDIFEIYNCGSHIPEDKIDEIWLPYKKADLSRSNTKGTGLGLAISRTILELHKFSYGAKNNDDGVVFWFKFR